jgi:hypothetical protein
MKYWMEAQGYNIDKNKIGRDNQSSMLLENNGRVLSSKRTRHINIRYFSSPIAMLLARSRLNTAQPTK